MMTRKQRIDYEILDCVLNRSRGSHGYSTTVPAFLMRLRLLFPDSVAREFTDACKRLSEQAVLHLQKYDRNIEGFHDYQDARDDVTFLDANSDGFILRASVETEKYFRQLLVLIVAPVGFKRQIGPDR
jgi:hypothetical protein